VHPAASLAVFYIDITFDYFFKARDALSDVALLGVVERAIERRVDADANLPGDLGTTPVSASAAKIVLLILTMVENRGPLS